VHASTRTDAHASQDELDPDAIDLRAPPQSDLVHVGAGNSVSSAASCRDEERGAAGSGGSVDIASDHGRMDGGGGGGAGGGDEMEPCNVEEVRRKRLERFG